MIRRPIFISGIGTGVGKTVASAVLCQQLRADYWKPVQSGDLDQTDSHRVARLTSARETQIHPERFRLNTPASPHQAALQDQVEIKLEDFTLPETRNSLVIEGAGGLLVPLSASCLMTDLVSALGAEVILVARDYLGCINHTLLSLLALEHSRIPLRHLILNGSFNAFSREAILSRLPVGCTWSTLPEFTILDYSTLQKSPVQLKDHANRI